MANTNFDGLVVSGVPTMGMGTMFTGNVFWVDSEVGVDSNDGVNGRSKDKPFDTIDYAVGLCTANNGDVIYVMPGHVETVASANALDFDVAGITVIGLGVGSSRPQINATATGSTTRVNANNVWLENLRFTGGIDAVAVALVINGVTDVTLRDIVYQDVTGQCTKFLNAANNSDRLTISNFRHIGDSAAGSTHSMTFDGCDDLVLEDFHIAGNFSTAAVGFITTASARVTVRAANGRPSKVWNQNAADVCFVDTITGSTGDFCGPIHLHLTDNAANITEAITGATFTLYDDIYVCNLANEKAMLINWTASTDA